VCHTPHFAPTPDGLLNFTSSPPAFSCTNAGCHSSEPPPIHSTVGIAEATAPSITRMADISGQMRKISGHHVLPESESIMRQSKEVLRSGIRNVGCADCHNPHAVNPRTTSPPFISGMLEGVTGIDRNGADVTTATYQYEVCFKCHSDSTPDFAYVPRVISTTNLRIAFNPENPSYHPVIDSGKNLQIPSIPSQFEPAMNASILMYCTDCHADDNGVSKGPHGSSYPPILKERYEMNDNTPETYDNYALCYRCHNRDSILADSSFLKNLAGRGGHSGHLAAGAPCSACHDPHGVNGSSVDLLTGSHTHLINFDTRIVMPAAGNQYPIYKDNGGFSGTCTLICHGVTHNNSSYP